MTQDEHWIAKYNEVMEFMEINHRNPSRHRIEEHDMLNWLKATRKKLNAGELKEERIVLFKKLLEMGERYKRVYQYRKISKLEKTGYNKTLWILEPRQIEL